MEIRLVLFLKKDTTSPAVPVDELRLNGDHHTNADIHRHMTSWLMEELSARFPVQDEDGLDREEEEDEDEEDEDEENDW